MERLKRDRKVRRVKPLRIIVAVVAVGVVGVAVWKVVDMVGAGQGSVVVENEEEDEGASVLIVDENAGDGVSARVREFVGRLQNDLQYEGYQIDRAVLPYQKTREVDVYLVGRGEYYKVSVDRGSAVVAEDVGRMVRYLDAREIYPQYVDIRIEGKAFYK